MAEVEGELKSSKDELGNAFKTLLVDIDNKDKEDTTNSYFTFIENLFTTSDI